MLQAENTKSIIAKHILNNSRAKQEKGNVYGTEYQKDIKEIFAKA